MSTTPTIHTQNVPGNRISEDELQFLLTEIIMALEHM